MSPSIFAPAGPGSREIAVLAAWVIGVLSVVAVLMLGLVLVAALRRRGSLEAHAPVDAGGGHSWIFVGGFLVPALTLFAIFGGGLRAARRFPIHTEGAHGAADLRVIGHQWWWEVHYRGETPDREVVTANEIHVPVGWSVEIELESRDVIHSFWVPALHGKVDMVPSQVNRLRIEADRAGRFVGQCGEYCGAQHANMRLVVVAEPLDRYEQWLAQQAAPAGAPADEEARRGHELFEARSCALCHTIRGTAARGLVGPDLTHLAGRAAIAANSLPNSRSYLEAWILHAQTLKPGALMPDLGGVDGDEAQAMTHYLEGLK